MTGEDHQYSGIEKFSSLVQFKRRTSIATSIHKQFKSLQTVTSTSRPPSEGTSCCALALKWIEGSTARQSKIFSMMYDDSLVFDISKEEAAQFKLVVDLSMRLGKEAQLDALTSLGIDSIALCDGLPDFEAARQLAMLKDDQQLVVGCVKIVVVCWIGKATVRGSARMCSIERNHLRFTQIGGAPELTTKAEHFA